jgi:NAD(P)-dependent dehydrogenase (short-subunit alcohol dehydrogenase family)
LLKKRRAAMAARRRIAVVGASRGIGLALVEALAERGERVVAVCRRASAELAELGVPVVEGVELTDTATVAVLRDALGDESLDALIYSAGINITFDGDVETVDVEQLALEYQVNTIGAVAVVQAVLPLLVEGSKVLLVTTGSGAAGRNARSAGNYGYRMSKAALNTFGFLLAGELEPRGIAVLLVTPGPTDTDMLRAVVDAGRTPGGGAPPRDVARLLVQRLDELSLETSGSWLARDGAPVLA